MAAKIDNKNNDNKEPKITGEEKKQRGLLFKKKRGGVVLTRDEVKAIKAGRKKLRKELKAKGIKSKKEFELTASSLGLYFDKNRFLALLWWFFGRHGGWLLLALAGLLLLLLLGVSYVTELRGHFTISMSDELFEEGLILSEDTDFSNPVSHLFSTPAEGVPCVSIQDIPADIGEHEGGSHNDYYFAHTFYVKNDGKKALDYQWKLRLKSESRSLADATWVMVFVDGEMSFYAHAQENGEIQALPAKDDSSRGYTDLQLYDQTKDPESQYEVVYETDILTYWRVLPKPFVSDDVVTEGLHEGVQPDEWHKYTVVIWLEGDDPDCTDELIGGHLGLDFYISVIDDEEK